MWPLSKGWPATGYKGMKVISKLSAHYALFLAPLYLSVSSLPPLEERSQKL